ncbi:cation diffusion facilitator family transporter [Aneurinibacillus sp. Ricciae_BoGa-3]|uniref:cation diffusion facilitator family transporter n=1 Tax=Aneurinibacillus sp. Ricciae_BoGa-3 TaxID=3022697 RepID=UPI0023408A42|nr:cation diffusion facilitator family transporter [Aneurinibacillus sp. Ricciae_BoGa-3]WCK54592.1 cation diffusion facilitator family transporter [Aneurinibacillus sp. Ricciae_BoGa-3]
MSGVERSSEKQNENRLRFAALITGLMFCCQLVGGYLTNSLAIMSDAWHLLSDLLALLLSWYAVRQTMKPADEKHTYGYHRFGSLAALINGLALIVISLFICYRAVLRLFHPDSVHSAGMMWLAGIGALGTFLIVVVLKQGEDNINVKSSLIHFLGDVFSYLGILLGGLIIQLTGWMFIDPILSVIFAAIILKNAWSITKEATEILLEAVPGEVSTSEVEARLLKEKAIRKVIDLHIWGLSNEHLSLTAHLQVENMYLEETAGLLHHIEGILHDEFKIAHTTIQLQTQDEYHNRIKNMHIPQVH